MLRDEGDDLSGNDWDITFSHGLNHLLDGIAAQLSN
jgi:hypothetical protein